MNKTDIISLVQEIINKVPLEESPHFLNQLHEKFLEKGNDRKADLVDLQSVNDGVINELQQFRNGANNKNTKTL